MGTWAHQGKMRLPQFGKEGVSVADAFAQCFGHFIWPPWQPLKIKWFLPDLKSTTVTCPNDLFFFFFNITLYRHLKEAWKLFRAQMLPQLRTMDLLRIIMYEPQPVTVVKVTTEASLFQAAEQKSIMVMSPFLWISIKKQLTVFFLQYVTGTTANCIFISPGALTQYRWTCGG